MSARTCGFANSCKTFIVSFDCILSVSFCEILKVFRFSWSTSPSNDREPVVQFICLTVHPVQCSIVCSWKEYGRKVMFLPFALACSLACSQRVDGVRWLYRSGNCFSHISQNFFSETFVSNVCQVLHCQVFNLDVCAFYDLKLFTQAYTGRTCLIRCLCYFCQCRLKIGGMWYVIVWRTLLDR